MTSDMYCYILTVSGRGIGHRFRQHYYLQAFLQVSRPSGTRSGVSGSSEFSSLLVKFAKLQFRPAFITHPNYDRRQVLSAHG